MDAFKTSPIVQELRWSCGFESSIIYFNEIDYKSEKIAVTINKDGIFGVWKIGETVYDLGPEKLDDDTLKEMATIPGAVKKIGDVITEEVKDYYEKNN